MSYSKSNIIDATSSGDSVKAAVLKNDDNVDDIFTHLNTQLGKTTAIEAKTDFISVTQDVDLDTMESAIATNTAKVTYPAAASETELNILDGATVTTAELNYVHGVTSAIQTQLNAKLANIVGDTTPELGGHLNGKDFLQYNTRLRLGAVGTTFINWSFDCSEYNQFSIEPTGDIELDFTNVKAGTVLWLWITGGGDHTITWKVGGATTNWKWAGGSEPSWATTTGIDVVILVGNGTDSLDAGLILGAVA